MAILAVVAVAILAAAFAAGTQVGRDRPPESTSVEAGFARDMQVHHAQAVEMSLVVRDRSNDPQIRGLAYDIATSQQQQMGQMAAWLQLWNLPAVGTQEQMAWMPSGDRRGRAGGRAGGSTPGHTRMGMSASAGRMPGMASPEELQRLRDADGRAAEVLFLQLMIRHHEAGAVMADSARQRTDVPVVRDLTSAIVTSQRNEMRVMGRLLSVRGASTLDRES